MPESTMYSLGDGNCLSSQSQNVCQSKASLEAFRGLLQKTYGDLRALNESWGTQFDWWGGVTPAPEEAAASLKTYPPWLDFRMHMDSQFIQIHQAQSAAISAVHANALVGFSARPGEDPYLGYDWHRLASALRVIGTPVTPSTMAKVRCYASRGAYTGLCLWFDGTPLDEARARWYPWCAAIHGLHSIWWGDLLSGTHPALSGDGTPTSLFAITAGTICHINETVGAVIRDGRRPSADIAIYDSRPSQCLAFLRSDHEAGLPSSEELFAKHLENLGYSYDLVCPEQLAENGMADYAVLALPSCLALSDEEVSAIRAFHARGGTLVADVLPGQFDDHGRPHTYGALHDVFVEWNDEAKPAEQESTHSSTETKPPPRAVLVGPGPPPADDPDEPARWGKLASALGQMDGVGPRRISRKNGEPFPGRYAEYDYGKGRLFIVQRDPGASESRVLVRVPDSGTLYDPLSGLEIRGSGKVTLRLDEEGATAVTHLPYRVVDFQITSVPEVKSGSRIPVSITLKTEGDVPGDHVVRVELRTLDNKSLRHAVRYLVCHDGRGETYIPTACNEIGLCFLRAHDALTGFSQQALIRLTASP